MTESFLLWNKRPKSEILPQVLTFTISRLFCPLTGIYKFSCHWQAILDRDFGMRDFPHLKAGTRNFKAKWGRDSGLTKTIIGITGWHKIESG